MNQFQVSKELSITQVEIIDEFWSERRKVNSDTAIYHQWEKLEEAGTINNFRIINGEIDKFREGYFYVDSDAHKWAEAAATILNSKSDKNLLKLLTDYLDLLISVQEEDGYIFSYNQYHFPKQRWTNFQIEHELYSLGHLIEAAIVTFQLTKDEKYLDLGKRAADLLVREFLDLSPKQTPGHPEVELSLVKLYRLTKNEAYLKLASRLIEKRGRFLLFGSRILKENLSQQKRADEVLNQESQYYGTTATKEKIMSDLSTDGPKGLQFRFFLSAFTGKYFQQNKPLKRQRKPVGHCVRWGYLVTAATMIYHETGDAKLLKSLQKSWNNMVQKKMYVTGGVGSLPLLEGFGRNYELNNRYAYNETCAAISSVFWSWELLLATGDAKYADLIEWQLYNSVLVGLSDDGKSYFYRNPLEVDESIGRKEWYRTACCPSNISRTLANLSKYIYSHNENNLWIHQYIGNKCQLNLNKNPESDIQMILKSELPWKDKIELRIICKENLDFFLNLRIPSWTSNPRIIVNGREIIDVELKIDSIKTASDLTPYSSYYVCIKEEWKKENLLEINFPIQTKYHISQNRVKGNRNKLAISRGPIVFCVEDNDNPGIDLSQVIINPEQNVSLIEKEGKLYLPSNTVGGEVILFRPYFSWGNAGKSSMRVWLAKE